ncbi:hypothetical protein V2J09_022811 [Rumex salicifolius]
MMGDIFAFSSEISLVAGKSKSRSSPGGAVRKTLADVTNIRPRTKSVVAEHKSTSVPTFVKDMDRLNKENETLKKETLPFKSELPPNFTKDMDRLNKADSKITELSATELQKLRLNLQSLYQQNLQLAQANSQMLAELSSGKDRLKALHHEVGCLKGVLNVKTVDEKKVVDCQQTTSNKVPTIKHDAAGESLDAENTNIKRSSSNRSRQSKGQSAAKDTTEERSENKRLCLRRKSSRLASEQPACTDSLPKLDDVKPAVNAGTDKEKSVNKRPCLRRQSSRLKSEEPASSEDLFELDDIKLPLQSQVDEKKSGDSSAPMALSDDRRMSIGRQLPRRAAGKVQSYKEMPVNVKMRRST